MRKHETHSGVSSTLKSLLANKLQCLIIRNAVKKSIPLSYWFWTVSMPRPLLTMSRPTNRLSLPRLRFNHPNRSMLDRRVSLLANAPTQTPSRSPPPSTPTLLLPTSTGSPSHIFSSLHRLCHCSPSLVHFVSQKFLISVSIILFSLSRCVLASTKDREDFFVCFLIKCCRDRSI